MNRVIEVKNLSKVYKTYKRESGFRETVKSFFKREEVVVKAVDDISFQIPQGEICGILGPNGAGKSTTIKMLCGALYPTRGDIKVMGYTPAHDRKKYVNEIGAVFGQKSQLIFDIPPLDSFNMNKAIYAISDAAYKETLDELTDLFSLGDIIKKPTRVLSLGERMKCEFVMTMLHRPKIVFLDEPTIGLDVIAKANVRDFIRKMNAKGVTFILTTHDLEDVEQLVDRVIIINFGKKVFDDTLSNLQLSLGQKKWMHLVLAPGQSFQALEGISVIEQKSDLELTLEVDLAKQSIGDFIENFSKRIKFTDISIKELPMEKIITNIYKETR